MAANPANPIRYETDSLNTRIESFEDDVGEFTPRPATGALLELLKAKKAKMEAAERERDEGFKQQPPPQN